MRLANDLSSHPRQAGGATGLFNKRFTHFSLRLPLPLRSTDAVICRRPSSAGNLMSG